jgi:hypothetical protein
MGLRRWGRYPAIPASAFEITRFSHTRFGGEKVPGGETGGAHGPRNEPSLCAGKTGRWLQMGVLYVEDLANHDDPESCVGIRKDGGEALTGEHAGRVLSREKFTVQGADAVETSGRQHGLGRYGERQPGPAWSETSRTRGSHLHGNRTSYQLVKGDIGGAITPLTADTRD